MTRIPQPNPLVSKPSLRPKKKATLVRDKMHPRPKTNAASHMNNVPFVESMATIGKAVSNGLDIPTGGQGTKDEMKTS